MLIPNNRLVFEWAHANFTAYSGRTCYKANRSIYSTVARGNFQSDFTAARPYDLDMESRGQATWLKYIHVGTYGRTNIRSARRPPSQIRDHYVTTMEMFTAVGVVDLVGSYDWWFNMTLFTLETHVPRPPPYLAYSPRRIKLIIHIEIYTLTTVRHGHNRICYS